MTKLGILREVAEHELGLMLNWRNEPRIRNNMYTRKEITGEEHLQWWSTVKSNDKNCYLMYELDETPLGIIGFNSIDRVNRNSSWAFYSSPEAPRGIGFKMEYLAVEYAFNILKLHKLYCEVLNFNTAVIRMHKKFGFNVEGILKEQHLYENKFIDIYQLGLLNRKWIENKDQMLEKINRLNEKMNRTKD